MTKPFTVLENNPATVNKLAYSLGLSQDVAFYDVYSLDEPEMLAMIPRPVHALLTIIPMTETWNESRKAEDSVTDIYTKSGPDEPVIWFKQTIRHGCGSIGTLHCTMNSGSTNLILPDSVLERLRLAALPLKMEDRAQLLADSKELYAAHEAAASDGDTIAPDADSADRLGHHFVAFVKGKDGHLYELEGNRKGPLDRGVLRDDEDLLSEHAIKLGLGKVIEEEKLHGGDLRFSCIALAPVMSG